MSLSVIEECLIGHPGALFSGRFQRVVLLDASVWLVILALLLLFQTWGLVFLEEKAGRMHLKYSYLANSHQPRGDHRSRSLYHSRYPWNCIERVFMTPKNPHEASRHLLFRRVYQVFMLYRDYHSLWDESSVFFLYNNPSKEEYKDWWCNHNFHLPHICDENKSSQMIHQAASLPNRVLVIHFHWFLAGSLVVLHLLEK